MGIHQETKHKSYVEGCFGCKISTVSFGTIPGGAKDQKNNVSVIDRKQKELSRYAEKRKAGEQPESTTFEGMEKTERRTEVFLERESDLRDNNPPEVVAQVKKSLTNVQE
jgi:hypothetical protein